MWDRLSVYLDNAPLTVGLLQLRFYRSLEGFASFLSGRAHQPPLTGGELTLLGTTFTWPLGEYSWTAFKQRLRTGFARWVSIYIDVCTE